MLSLFSLSTSLPNERARKFVLKNEGFLHSIEFCSISGLKCYSAMASSDCSQCCHGDRGLLFQQGTASPFPLSEHLYPCPMRCHFNFFFKNQFNSYCLPNMKAFLGKKKKYLFYLPNTPYVLNRRKKKNFTKPKVAIFETPCVHSSKAEDCTFFPVTCCVISESPLNF